MSPFRWTIPASMVAGGSLEKRAELRLFFQLGQPGIGDRGPIDGRVLQCFEAVEIFETGIADRGPTQVQEFDTDQSHQMDQVGISDTHLWGISDTHLSTGISDTHLSRDIDTHLWGISDTHLSRLKCTRARLPVARPPLSAVPGPMQKDGSRHTHLTIDNGPPERFSHRAGDLAKTCRDGLASIGRGPLAVSESAQLYRGRRGPAQSLRVAPCIAHYFNRSASNG